MFLYVTLKVGKDMFIVIDYSITINGKKVSLVPYILAFYKNLSQNQGLLTSYIFIIHLEVFQKFWAGNLFTSSAYVVCNNYYSL